MNIEEHDYTSDPFKLALADELAVLNQNLLDLGLSDQARLYRLRMYAEASKDLGKRAELAGVTLSDMNDTTDQWTWTATFRGQVIGRYESPRLAHVAYRAAHIEYYGTGSQYHPEHTSRPLTYEPMPGEASNERVLPQGVRMQGNRFYASITRRTNGKRNYHHIGSFSSPEEASAAYEAERERLKLDRQARKNRMKRGGVQNSKNNTLNERTPSLDLSQSAFFPSTVQDSLNS